MLETFVAAVQMVDIADLAGAARHQRGEDQSSAGPHIESTDPGPVERRWPVDLGRLPTDGDLSSHLAQLVQVAKAVVVDPLVDDAAPAGLRQEDAEDCLKVGGEAGVWEGLNIGGPQRLPAANGEAVIVPNDLGADLLELPEERLQMVAADVL